ncbi:hypothetical protein ONE63_002764 [Megalurothrips usitatus]|uniref:DUF7802 domain-containing protein n=1 Tax=Megalurothrips usitatus TaxID=439358 RepID=A0AAV7X8M7_9NEOP|nr:hypothetical protein ONE63_002764 [Megalurothrips usitatus]
MAVGESLAPGTVLGELRFQNDADWWIKVHDVGALWRAQPTYILAQAAYLIGALFTLIHALSSRGRWAQLWIATVFHGLVVESLSYVLPDVDNFWHSQTPLIFLGRRLPLHIAFLYPVFIYQATVAVSKLRLPRWAEPCAVGLTVVLIDIPYDIMCVKFVHWTWHDTDPNIGDRHYWVPWNSYYFHATFAAAFTFWFHLLRDHPRRWQRVARDALNLVMASLLGTPLGVLMFPMLYHTFHDIYKVHSEVTFFALFAVFLAVSWAGTLSAAKDPVVVAKESLFKCWRPGERSASWRTWLLVSHLALHYALWMWMAAFGRPEREVSTGLHEPTGPCGVRAPMQTASGLVLEKDKYLCKTDYDEKYFDFHCLPGGEPPRDGAHWYTICGTPFENRAEYILVIGTITLTALIVFFNMHFRAAPDSALLRPGAAGPNKQAKLKTR